MVLRTHVYPNDPVGFVDGIRYVPYALPEVGTARNIGHRKTHTIHTELPPVIDAGQARLLVSPEIEGGSAVRAQGFQYSDPAFGVAKGNKILTEQAETDGT